LVFNVLILITGSHCHDDDSNTFHQGVNIQITGIPNAASDNSQCPQQQHCKVGKAGPQGRHGEKGEKGAPAETCECITNQVLLDKVNHLQDLLLHVVSKTSRDCQDIQTYFPSEAAGVQIIFPSFTEVQVYCDVEDDGRIWTVLQKRFDGSEDFYRERNDYINGFGRKDSEYWLGLDNIHTLTRNGDYELKVNVEDWEGVKKHALYSTFIVGSRESDYTLTIGGYSGTAGDSMTTHNGQKFSTKDHDVDSHPTSSYNCAQIYKGGWWYNACHRANPNGLYLRGNEGSNAKGVNWYNFFSPPKHYSHKSIELKIRRKV